MTTRYALPILLLTGTGLHAQGNFPFPDSGARWVQTYSFMVAPPDPIPSFEVQAVANIQVNGLDTLINGSTYAQLTDAVTGHYYGALQDDAGRVWHVPPDSTQAYILYDFTVEPGDTVHDVVHYPGFPVEHASPMLVDVIIGDVMVEPSWGGRRVVQTDGWPWIEGIGHGQGLLAEHWINVSNYLVVLECMSHLDTIRYQYQEYQEMPGTCALDHMGVMNAVPSSFPLVSPNPSTGAFLLDAPLPSGAVVVDITGRAVLTVQPWARTVDLTGHPAGTYVLRPVFPAGSATRLVVQR